MQISIEKLIQLVTAEVVKELQKQGVEVVGNLSGSLDVEPIGLMSTKSEKIDMSGYKTPVLTEQHIRKLHELTGEVMVPQGTIITPKAREIIKDKQLKIVYQH